MRPLRVPDLATPAPRFDMETLVGYILLGGVLLSMGLIVAGISWHWAAAGRLGLDYPLAGGNLFQFVLADLRRTASGVYRPRLLVSTGIITLMLTPYARVAASMLYFATAEHNWKYTLFTLFVFAVLSYSLFLR